MRPNRWSHIFVAFIVMNCGGCIREEAAETKPAPSASLQRTLLHVLASPDPNAAVAALEEVKARGLQREALAQVQEAWTTRDSLLQNLRSTEDKRAVQVAIADVLLQARINGFWPQESRSLLEMRDLLRAVAQERSSHAALQAISALSAIDDEESVELLAALARGSDDNKARAAIVGLAYMCHSSAARVLERTARELPSRKDFVLDQLKKGEALKNDIAQCQRRAAIMKAT
jgi:hypothetical protein